MAHEPEVSARTNGCTVGQPAWRSSEPTMVNVQREETVSSTSSTGPSGSGAGHLEGAAHVVDLLGAVGHLALGLVWREPW